MNEAGRGLRRSLEEFMPLALPLGAGLALSGMAEVALARGDPDVLQHPEERRRARQAPSARLNS